MHGAAHSYLLLYLNFISTKMLKVNLQTVKLQRRCIMIELVIFYKLHSYFQICSVSEPGVADRLYTMHQTVC